MFTTFCAIGLLNAQLLDRTFSLSRRLKVSPGPFHHYLSFPLIHSISASGLVLFLLCGVQVLLDLARGLFEETASLDAMMSKVMKEAQELIPCEHCTIIIVDQENTEVSAEQAYLQLEYNRRRSKMLLQSAQYIICAMFCC